MSNPCPGCGQAVDAQDRLFCPSCGTSQHKACVSAKGGCSSCGVSFAVPSSPGPAPAAPAAPATPPAPVHTQPCKNCQKPVQTGLAKCPSCGAAVQTTSLGKILLLVGCVSMIMVIPIVAILAAILVPNFIRARAQGQTTACKSNLKNIATACEMYSTDNKGLYPDSMSKLTPMYLRFLPTCPSAEADTYSATYEVATEPHDAYTFYCRGENHRAAGLPVDFPQYNSMQGLVDRK